MFERRPLLIILTWVMMISFVSATTVIGSDPREEDLSLLEMDLQDLMNMEVSVASKQNARLSDAPGIISVTTREDMDMFGAKNLYQVISRMPSMFMIGSYLFPNNLASVRGDLQTHVNNHTLILLNGRPIRDNDPGGLNMNILMGYPVEMVERIELIRGPGSTIYGTNAFTGVINIVTVEGQQDALRIRAEGGSKGYARGSVSGSYATENSSFNGSFSGVREDGWMMRGYDEVGTWGNQRKSQHGWSGAVEVKKGKFSVNTFLGELDQSHMGRLPRWSIQGDEFDSKFLFLDTGYEIPLGEKWRVTGHGTVYQNEFSFKVDSRDSTNVLGEVTLFGAPTEKLKFIGGYVIEHQSGRGGLDNSVDKYSRVPQSLYAQLEAWLLKDWALIGGLQWNKPDNLEGDLISRLGTIYHFTSQWGIKLLYGQAFRSASAMENYIDKGNTLQGNESLKPEGVTTYDAQLFYQGDRSQVSLTYFYNTMKDLNTRSTVGGVTSYIDGDGMNFQGLELEGKLYVNQHLYGLGSLTYQDSTTDPGMSKSLVPHIMGNLGIGYDHGDWTTGLFYQYYSKPPKIEGVTEYNPVPKAAHLVDLNVTYDLTKVLRQRKGSTHLNLRVENLLDQDVYFPEFGRRNLNSLQTHSGILIYIGADLRF